MNYTSYASAVAVKGLRRPITIDQAYSDFHAKAVAKHLFMGLSKDWHARLAIAAKNELARLQLAWKTTADAAMIRLEGRKFEVADYRISGVGRDEFSTEEKTALREICKRTNIASSAFRAHALVATASGLKKMQQRYANDLA